MLSPFYDLHKHRSETPAFVGRGFGVQRTWTYFFVKTFWGIIICNLYDAMLCLCGNPSSWNDFLSIAILFFIGRNLCSCMAPQLDILPPQHKCRSSLHEGMEHKCEGRTCPLLRVPPPSGKWPDPSPLLPRPPQFIALPHKLYKSTFSSRSANLRNKDTSGEY